MWCLINQPATSLQIKLHWLNKHMPWFFLWLLVWFLYNILTLNISPLPWFDEVFLADITNSLNETGKLSLRLSLNPEDLGREVLIYGPVYFYMQAFLIRLFDLSPFVFRTLNMLSGMLIVLLVFRLAKKLNMDKIVVVLLVLLLTTDTIFLSNMHSGRMDLVAVFFFYLGLYMFIFKREVYYSFISGLILAASFLSTPRVGFYFLSIIALFIYELLGSRRNLNNVLLRYTILATFFIIPVSFWIFNKFESPFAYFHYFIENTLMQEHFGLSLIPNKYQFPIVFIWFLLYLLILYKREFQLADLIFGVLIISHLLFIKEVGPYSAMIMPVLYVSVLFSYQRLKNKRFHTKIISILILLILLLNSSIFMLKSSLIIVDKEARDSKTVKQQLMQFDLSGKSIMADYEYFYVIKELGGNYIAYDYNSDLLNYSILKNIDFVLLSDRRLKEFSERFSESINSQVHIYSMKQSGFYTFIKRFGYDIEANYNGFLIEIK